MVVILMGVTGSGKTTVGQQLAEELGWKYYDADDFHSPANLEKMTSGTPLNDGNRRPWLETLRLLICNSLDRGENAVLACSALKQSYRDLLLINDGVKLIYLKGDYELIQKRLSERHGHYMDPTLVESQFDILEEPSQETTVDISATPDQIVNTIRRQLEL